MHTVLRAGSWWERSFWKVVFHEILPGTDRIFHYQKMSWKQAKKFVPTKMNKNRGIPATGSKFLHHCVETLRNHQLINAA